MKSWLAVILAWIVSLFTFWKLGQRDGKQTLQISQREKKEETISRAVRAGTRAVSAYRMRNKK